ncbi:protein FAR1-RELATED SEQUENCE 6-like [Camellia sinensis]|uniref:protein FAR1-RELATED SEQUENCE 6-like n=1 Tax=Camellia sinensis TaxID=4442 RepID=UPI001035AEDD|nr:protein FAR1-RELATED SEQUENCE 6-like [Camellia sinensis]
MVVEVGGFEALTFDKRDARNHIEKARRLRLGVGDAESVAFYFHRMQQQNSNFYSEMDFDGEGRLRNLFWADARSRAAYKAFRDVVTFDTTYLTNKYDMPFAPAWLSCTSNTPLNNIITDQGKAMQNAIQIVFPQARHRWCLWHIMKKILEKLRAYSQYESIKLALQKTVYESFTKNEFDEEWQAMIAKFSLHDNDWLGVLYDERHRWIPACVKDIFLVEIKDRVRQTEAGCASNVPPSTNTIQPSNTSPKTQASRSSTNASMTRKVLSPMVARRRGRPCTKRKVSKVDDIVNRLKGKNKKASKLQALQLYCCAVVFRAADVLQCCVAELLLYCCVV